MSLFSLTQNCPSSKIPGMSSTGYVGLFPEIDAFPRTVAEIALEADPLATLNPGDTKKLGEAITYKTGGYHRFMPILVDTGLAENNSEGEIGGQMNRGRFTAFIPGNGDEVREWLDYLLEHSGCLHIVGKSKSGQTLSFGTPDYPCYVESYTGGSGGDRAGYEVVFYTGHPKTNHSMDLTQFPLGLTPAA